MSFQVKIYLEEITILLCMLSLMSQCWNTSNCSASFFKIVDTVRQCHSNPEYPAHNCLYKSQMVLLIWWFLLWQSQEKQSWLLSCRKPVDNFIETYPVVYDIAMLSDEEVVWTICYKVMLPRSHCYSCTQALSW